MTCGGDGVEAAGKTRTGLFPTTTFFLALPFLSSINPVSQTFCSGVIQMWKPLRNNYITGFQSRQITGTSARLASSLTVWISSNLSL